MQISYIKSKKDYKSFVIPKTLGFNVIELEDEEQIDNSIENLVKENCNTIVLSNDIAGFSENIIKKYYNSKDVNIIIAPSKRL